MASDVDICNLALLRLGTRSSISALTEGSTEANACALVYPIVRDTLLAQHHWGFATRRVALADLGSPPGGVAADSYDGAGRAGDWRFRYAYPTDCLHARGIRPPSGTTVTWDDCRPRHPHAIRFEVSGDQDGSGNPIKVILTDQPQAELIYTARITAAAQFDAGFIEALSWMLAAELAVTLTGDKVIAQACVEAAGAAIGGAKANDANESPEIDDRMPDWIAAYGNPADRGRRR
jgi:hypothetical protein